MTANPAARARLNREGLRHTPIEALIGADGMLDPDRLEEVRDILTVYRTLVTIPEHPHPDLSAAALAHGTARYTEGSHR